MSICIWWTCILERSWMGKGQGPGHDPGQAENQTSPPRKALILRHGAHWGACAWAIQPSLRAEASSEGERLGGAAVCSGTDSGLGPRRPVLTSALSDTPASCTHLVGAPSFHTPQPHPHRHPAETGAPSRVQAVQLSPSLAFGLPRAPNSLLLGWAHRVFAPTPLACTQRS